MSRADPQFKLRMPPALRAQVEHAAEQANRSLNAEIVTRLQVSFVHVMPEVSANERFEPVPASAALSGLRLLCLLGTSGSADGAQPVATMQPLPPRARINGQWPSACRAPLVLRETQAWCPTAEVLARCERHRQANALRAPARTVRTGGVSA